MIMKYPRKLQPSGISPKRKYPKIVVKINCE